MIYKRESGRYWSLNTWKKSEGFAQYSEKMDTFKKQKILVLCTVSLPRKLGKQKNKKQILILSEFVYFSPKILAAACNVGTKENKINKR